MAQSASQVTPQQQNLLARQAVIRQSVDMWLPIFAQTFTAANNQGPGTIINVPLRNVGLVKRLVIKVISHLTTTATGTRTARGIGNFFSNVTFTDLSNQQRISTTGWHLQAVASAKRRRVYVGAAALDEPSLTTVGTRENNAFGYGNTHSVILLPATLPAGNYQLNTFVEVPFAYTDHDLRGAIYANVTNATMNLQMTVNPNIFTVTGAQNIQSGVASGAAGSITLNDFTITVYQNFLDQLPIAQQGGPVLPLLDLSTAYLLNNTSVSGVVANQDNPIPYANFRDFMSTTVIYEDPNEYTGGSQINYWSLQSANYTNIFKVDPQTNFVNSRLIIFDDFPLGMHYFDHRAKPVSTIQYGNMQLIANPSGVASSATAFLVGFESLALINMITQAGSLYGS